jgi:hypothetical protein
VHVIGRLSLVACIAMLLICCTSCSFVSIPPVDDLKLVAVDVVRARDMPDHDWLASSRPADLLVFRIRFSTAHDFDRLAKRYGYGAKSTISICKGNSVDPAKEIGYLQVDDEFGSISPYWQSKVPYRDKTAAGEVIYHVYFNVSFEGGNGAFAYDLSHVPEDICVRIEGGNGFIGFISNTLVIPRRVIVNALRRATPVRLEKAQTDAWTVAIDSADADITIEGANGAIYWNRDRITCEELRARLPFLFQPTPDPPALTIDCKPAETKPRSKADDNARGR